MFGSIESYNISQIDDKLWLGNLNAAEDIQDLKRKGIKKILSILTGYFPTYERKDNFIHKKVDADDNDSQNIIQYFGECLNFINGEEKVLVHCGAGVSRSSSIVIAFIMWKRKLNFEDAVNFVKEKRPFIWPNAGFREQLKIFGKKLVENNYNIDKIKFKEIKWEPPENIGLLL